MNYKELHTFKKSTEVMIKKLFSLFTNQSNKTYDLGI